MSYLFKFGPIHVTQGDPPSPMSASSGAEPVPASQEDASCKPPSEPGSRAQEKLTAHTYITDIHDSLDPVTELAVVAALRRYATLDNSPRSCCSCFAGSEVKEKLDDALYDFWAKRYNIKFDCMHDVKAEHHKGKKQWLIQQYPNLILANSVADLAADVVDDCNSGQSKVIPHFNRVDAGFPCTSRSSHNQNAKANLNCCQEGSFPPVSHNSKYVSEYLLMDQGLGNTICVYALGIAPDHCPMATTRWVYALTPPMVHGPAHGPWSREWCPDDDRSGYISSDSILQNSNVVDKPYGPRNHTNRA